MEREDPVNDGLKDLLRRLPGHEAPSDLWERMQTKLLLQENFGLSMQELPGHPAPQKIWQNISDSLNNGDRRINYRLMLGLVGVAASLLIATLFFIEPFHKQDQQPAIVTYEEDIDMEHKTERADLSTQEAMHMIREYCALQSIQCEDDEFEQMVAELNELTDDIKRLESMYPTYIDPAKNPELVKMKLKIENTHAEILKTLITIIQS
jgi:uncharacterized protein YdcH (DUF465 family)